MKYRSVRPIFHGLIASFLIVVLPTAMAWWSPEWTQRKAIAVDTTTNGVNLQTKVDRVPVLVRLHTGNFPQFLNVRDGGMDFRFIAADDQTPLKYHIEKFDPASQIALAWVAATNIDPQSTDNKFHLYFGNQAAVNGENGGATYDGDTALVLHFNEAAGVKDSTAYATQVTGNVISDPASIIGNGAILSGTEPLQIADSEHLKFDVDKGFTVSLWTRFDQLPDTQIFLFDRVDPLFTRLSLTVVDGFFKVTFGDADIVASQALTPMQWQQVAFSVNQGELTLFIDGQQVASAPVIPGELTGPISIGGSVESTGLASVRLDELQISTIARSADYIALGAAVQGPDNDRVITYAGDESAGAEGAADGGGHASHFGIIIQNVFGRSEAIVEQIVIGICVVMAAIAMMVMFIKAVNLSRARRATSKFLSSFNALSAQGQALDSLLNAQKAYGESPLFRVYSRSFEELNQRISPSTGAAKAALDGKSLGAIGAALDAVMVREGQKLNSLLVLLTIAISGGPFVGLLGTVVGVMVTFAAIAATGDVNIAAIAPGMAAALLATVAGLGVAIPALFGYNYLSAKVKEITADMHVFADELSAKINEQYGA